jgi:hypothetical protein
MLREIAPVAAHRLYLTKGEAHSLYGDARLDFSRLFLLFFVFEKLPLARPTMNDPSLF